MLLHNTLAGIVYICAVFVCVMSGCGAFTQNDRIIARVGASVLTDAMMRESVGDHISGADSLRIKRDFVNRWIEQELLYQGALLKGYGEDRQIHNEITRIRKQLITDRYLDRELEWRPEDSEDEMQQYYQNTLDNYNAEETSYILQHITVNTVDDAKKVMAEIKKGIELEELQSEDLEVSVGALSYLQNPIPEKAISKEYFKVIQRLKPGETGNYFLLNNVYHIIKLIDKISEGEPIPLKYIHHKVEEQFYLQKRKEGFDNLLRKLGNELDVYVYADLEIAPFSVKSAGDSLLLGE